jgi:hypothetical protein
MCLMYLFNTWNLTPNPHHMNKNYTHNHRYRLEYGGWYCPDGCGRLYEDFNDPKLDHMNNKDQMETLLASQDFKKLLNACEDTSHLGGPDEYKEARDNFFDFIRQHFTPKTVEENFRLVKVQGVLTLASYHQYSDYASLFYGTREECEAEKQRLESQALHVGGDGPILTKGREEKGEFFCDADYIERCSKQCPECALDQRSKPTPNRDNYRERLERIATVAMASMINDEPKDPDTILEIPKNIASWSVLYAKELIKAIDKEVKSNLASE